MRRIGVEARVLHFYATVSEVSEGRLTIQQVD
jgi:hypothetical protein